MRRGYSGPAFVLAAILCGISSPGCFIGSPVSAFSGEPYGMTRDDVDAIRGKKGRIWSGAPFFAGIDIPFAFVLDTGFLPISLPIWGIKALASGSGEDDDHHDDGGEDPERMRDVDQAPGDDASDMGHEGTQEYQRDRERGGQYSH